MNGAQLYTELLQLAKFKVCFDPEQLVPLWILYFLNRFQSLNLTIFQALIPPKNLKLKNATTMQPSSPLNAARQDSSSHSPSSSSNSWSLSTLTEPSSPKHGVPSSLLKKNSIRRRSSRHNVHSAQAAAALSMDSLPDDEVLFKQVNIRKTSPKKEPVLSSPDAAWKGERNHDEEDHVSRRIVFDDADDFERGGEEGLQWEEHCGMGAAEEDPPRRQLKSVSSMFAIDEVEECSKMIRGEYW